MRGVPQLSKDRSEQREANQERGETGSSDWRGGGGALTCQTLQLPCSVWKFTHWWDLEIVLTKVKIWLMCPREKDHHARILRYYTYPANARNIRTQSKEPRSIPIFSLPPTEASSVLTRAGVHHGTCSRTAQTSLSHARNSARPDVERCCRLSIVQNSLQSENSIWLTCT